MGAAERAPCPDENLLVSLIEGRLSHEALRAIEDHVDSCPRCESFLHELGGVLAPPATDRSPSPLRPARIGRYEILQEVGSGAMGVVYAAFDPELRRKVAIKLLRPDLTPRAQLPSARARLLREARLLAGLSHPNVVGVYDVGAVGDDVFMAVELVEGRSLDACLRDDRPDHDGAVDIFLQAARGLAAAHRAGLVHRDVKPANILVGSDGRVRVTDFGLATMDRRDEASGVRPSEHADTTLRTASGAIVGTPAYMAPEQYAGGRADARSDQYSFCVALGEALTGERPITGAHVEDMEQASARPPAPRALLEIAERGIRPRPADRFENMDALVEALERARASKTGAMASARPWRRWLVAGAAALALAAAALAMLTPPPVAGERERPEALEASAGPPSLTPDPARDELPTTALPAPSEPEAARSFAPSAPPLPSPLVPSASPVASESASKALLDARRSHGIGQGAACLGHLGRLSAAAPEVALRPDVQQMRAQCEMLAGDCEAGRNRLRSLLSHAYQGEALDRAIDANAAPSCKRAKAPADSAAAVEMQALLTQAQQASQQKDVARCKAISQKLASFGKAHDIGNQPSLRPLAHAVSAQITQCLVSARDCALARRRWRAEYERQFPDIVATGTDLDRVFYESYPACKP